MLYNSMGRSYKGGASMVASMGRSCQDRGIMQVANRLESHV